MLCEVCSTEDVSDAGGRQANDGARDRAEDDHKGEGGPEGGGEGPEEEKEEGAEEGGGAVDIEGAEARGIG